MTNSEILVKAAVEQTVGLINHDRLQPEAALIKTAKELKLNPNFIKRASEALNVALTYKFLKTAEDKAADFPIIDAQNVTKAIYGEKLAENGAYVASHFSSNQSAESGPKFDRYINDPRYKRAYAEILATEAPNSFPLSESGLFEKAANYLKRLLKTKEAAVAQEAGCSWDANQAFCDILAQFSKSAEYRASWADFESQVFSKHGEAAVDYLDLLYKTAGQSEPRGQHDSKHQLFTPCREAVMFDQFIGKSAELRELAKQAEEATENYQFERGNVSSIFREHIEDCEKKASVHQEIASLSSLGIIQKKRNKLKEVDTEADPVLKVANERLIQELDEREEMVKRAFGLLEMAGDKLKGEGIPGGSIATNSEADNRHRQFILQELAVSDPILKNVEPHKLVEHYSQMLAIAPELAREKEIVRSTLRSMSTSQALDPFTAQQLAQSNNELLKQRQLVLGRGPGQEQKS